MTTCRYCEHGKDQHIAKHYEQDDGQIITVAYWCCQCKCFIRANDKYAFVE